MDLRGLIEVVARHLRAHELQVAGKNEVMLELCRSAHRDCEETLELFDRLTAGSLGDIG